MRHTGRIRSVERNTAACLGDDARHLLGEGGHDHRQAAEHRVEQLVRQGEAVVLDPRLEQHQRDVAARGLLERC